MHKRIVSHIILLATILAVISIVVIQPRNTARYQKNLGAVRNPLIATPDDSPALKAGCEGIIGGGVVGEDGTCIPSTPTCNGEACNAMTCGKLGYGFNEATGACIQGGSASVNISSLSGRDEIECLAALHPVARDANGGIDTGIIVLVQTICAVANGMGDIFGNDAVRYVAPQIIKEEALQALSNARAPMIPYLTEVSLIFNRLFNAKSSPQYQTKPLEYIKEHVTDPLVQLIAEPPEEKKSVEPPKNETPPVTETPPPATSAPVNANQTQAIRLFTKIKGLFTIREAGIARTALSTQKTDSLKQSMIIRDLLDGFTACFKDITKCHIP